MWFKIVRQNSTFEILYRFIDVIWGTREIFCKYPSDSTENFTQKSDNLKSTQISESIFGLLIEAFGDFSRQMRNCTYDWEIFKAEESILHFSKLMIESEKKLDMF